MKKGIAKGDEVVTVGGVHGKVTGTTDDVLTLEIAALKGERVRIKVDRSRIDRVSQSAKGEEKLITETGLPVMPSNFATAPMSQGDSVPVRWLPIQAPQ